jgi:hypothetical protein
MKASGRQRAPVALTPGKHPVSLRHETGWSPQLVWVVWTRDKFPHLARITPRSSCSPARCFIFSLEEYFLTFVQPWHGIFLSQMSVMVTYLSTVPNFPAARRIGSERRVKSDTPAVVTLSWKKKSSIPLSSPRV